MKTQTSLRDALADPNLLGNALAGPSWAPWRALLLAANGEALTADELELFRKFTGRQVPPTARADELWAVVGRRGGKSRAIAVLVTYLACLCQHPKLVRGETGVALVIAPDIRQARVILEYAHGVIEESPLLRQTLLGRTADTLKLKGNIRIEVRSSSFRRIRGITAIAVLCDEVAFFQADDSLNPDQEILAAARPALASTRGPLICISSPHARRGVLWEAYKRHYGPDGDPLIMVAQGTTRDFNSDIDQTIIDQALDRDHAAASAEYLAQFRTDIEAFITREAVEACIDNGVRERPHARSQTYKAFCDPSGGSSDSMTLAISHSEGKTQILDVVRERKPPFSPESVVDEFSKLMRDYRISTVTGDRYAGEWVAEAFRKNSINYEPSEKSKSDIYVDLLPLINSRAVALLENDRIVAQLTQLERRTARGGKDSIDHPRGGHDDLANAVAGALVFAYRDPGIKNFNRKLEYQPIGII